MASLDFAETIIIDIIDTAKTSDTITKPILLW